MKKINIKSIVWKEGKYFVAQCLNFDVSSFGITKNSAIRNLEEAVYLFLEDIPKQRVNKPYSLELFETTLQYA